MVMKKTKETVRLSEKLNEIYGLSGSLETSCCRQCSCCRVACPQMKYSEALQIITGIWNNWTKEEKRELLMTCIEYFFSRSLVKPCPMLSESTCKVYKDRPLNCRLYGLWPKEMWEKRVETISKKLDLEKEKIPLNTQCQFVQLKRGGALSEDAIQKMFDAIDALDIQILSGEQSSSTGADSKKKSDGKVIGMVRNNWNYRTIHDWILFFFWGEEKLASMTDVALIASKTQLDAFMKTMREMASGGLFDGVLEK